MSLRHAPRGFWETVKANKVLIPYIALVVTIILILALRDLLP